MGRAVASSGPQSLPLSASKDGKIYVAEMASALQLMAIRRLGGADPPHVRSRLRKRKSEPITAAHNDRFVGYVGFAIWKRKQLVGGDFVA